MTKTAKRWDCNCADVEEHGCQWRGGKWRIWSLPPIRPYPHDHVATCEHGYCLWCGALLNADGTITKMAPASEPSIEWILRILRNCEANPDRTQTEQWQLGWTRAMQHVALAIDCRAKHQAPAPPTDAATTAPAEPAPPKPRDRYWGDEWDGEAE